MKFHLKSSGLILVLAVLCLGVMIGFYVAHDIYRQEFVKNVRPQIKKELQDEQLPLIEQLVKKEVQRVHEEELARRSSLKSAHPETEIQLTSQVVTSQDASDEPLDDLSVHRIIQEIYASDKARREAFESAKIASDEMLDQHVAGAGIKPDTMISGGYVKTPQLKSTFEIAKASQGDSRPSVSDMKEEIAGEKPQSDAIDRTLQQKGSVLLGKGKLIFEPSFTYAHFSTNRINIQGVTILEVFTIGPVSTEKINRDILIQTMGFKYGLMDNLQAQLRIPTRFEFDRVSNSDQTTEDTRSKGGLGDIDLSISRQIGWEEGWKPDLIASVGIKSNSGEPIYNNSVALGTGHWALSGSLVAAKSSDPAVIFGSLGYSHSFEESFDNYGKIQPGDTYSYSFGVAIALSYQTAINFSYDQSFTQKLERGGQAVVGSFVNSANFKTGVNWAFNERSSVDLSVALGLTTDSPDMTVEIRFPYYF